MNQENNYYVYLHKRKNNGSIFYVGKGTGNRCFVKHGRNKYWHNIVNKNGYSVEIVKNELTLSESLIFEKNIIENLRKQGITLCNQTNGGDGYPGFVVNDETKQKFRIAKLGKKQSPEHAKKSAIARLGKTNSKEHRERTVAQKRKKIINSDGICFISSCHAAMYLSEVLKKRCHQGIISMCARGIRNNAYGLTWSYNTNEIPFLNLRKSPSKKILNITKNICFLSVSDACRWLSEVIGVAKNQCISHAARSNGKLTAYGCAWRYI